MNWESNIKIQDMIYFIYLNCWLNLNMHQSVNAPLGCAV